LKDIQSAAAGYEELVLSVEFIVNSLEIVFPVVMFVNAYKYI